MICNFKFGTKAEWKITKLSGYFSVFAVMAHGDAKYNKY